MAYPDLVGMIKLNFEKVGNDTPNLKGSATLVYGSGQSKALAILGSLESNDKNDPEAGKHRWFFRNERHTTKEHQFLFTVACTESGQMGVGFYCCVFPVDDGTLLLKYT